MTEGRIRVNRDDDPGTVAETFAAVLTEMGLAKVTNLDPDGEDSCEYLIELPDSLKQLPEGGG